MTTRNFRVNNGLEVGDIVISASANTITGGATAAPSADGQFANKKFVDDKANLTILNTSVVVSDTGSNGAITNTADAGVVLSQTAAATTITASGDIALTAGGDVNIPVNVGLEFAGAEKIESDGTDLSITVGAGGDINIPANIGLTFGDDGEKIEGDGTDLTISSSGLCTITATGQTVITNDLVVSGNLTVDGTNTIINTTTLAIEDNLIEVNRTVSAASGMPVYSGMVVNRGVASDTTEEDLFWVWDEGFADDGTTIHGNAGGAWTALRASRGVDNASPITATETNLVDVRCNVIHALATSAQYADVAERFEADAPMATGSVVMVGGEAEITETTADLSDQVFGVISDQPAYAMNAGAGDSDSHPFVAMTGRTPVRVTGAVTKGQRLVSSSIKGCARAAATGESYSPFHVIGRALENSTDAGIKLVNCAVRTNN